MIKSIFSLTVLILNLSQTAYAAKKKYELPKSTSNDLMVASKCGDVQLESIAGVKESPHTFKYRIAKTSGEVFFDFEIIALPGLYGPLIWSPSCKFLLLPWAHLVDIKNRKVVKLPKPIVNNFNLFDEKRNFALDDSGQFLGMSGWRSHDEGRISYWNLQNGLKVLDVSTTRTSVNNINISFDPESTIVRQGTSRIDLSKVVPDPALIEENNLREAQYPTWKPLKEFKLEGNNQNKSLLARGDGLQLALAGTRQFEPSTLQLFDLDTDQVTDVFSDILSGVEVKRIFPWLQYSDNKRTLLIPITNKKNTLPVEYSGSDYQHAPYTHVTLVDTVAKSATLFPVEVNAKAGTHGTDCQSWHDQFFLISPDGSTVVYTTCDEKLYFMDSATGRSTYQMDIPGWHSMKFSSDGKNLAISQNSKNDGLAIDRLVIYKLNQDHMSSVASNFEVSPVLHQGYKNPLYWTSLGIAVTGDVIGPKELLMIYDPDSGRLVKQIELKNDLDKYIDDIAQSDRSDFFIRKIDTWGTIVGHAKSYQVLNYLPYEDTGIPYESAISANDKTMAITVGGIDGIGRLLIFVLPKTN